MVRADGALGTRRLPTSENSVYRNFAEQLF
jgi:hypothetical protein